MGFAVVLAVLVTVAVVVLVLDGSGSLSRGCVVDCKDTGNGGGGGVVVQAWVGHWVTSLTLP